MLKKDKSKLDQVKRKSTRIKRSDNKKHFSVDEKRLEMFGVFSLTCKAKPGKG